MSSHLDARQYLQGALCGLAAVSIWSGWIVVARLGLQMSLTPWDIAALRFGIAGILLPYLFKNGLAIDRLGWLGLTAIVLGGTTRGCVLAGGVLTTGKRIGFALILPGVLAIAWGSGGELGSWQNVGHGLFLSAGLAWACYTVAMRRARLDGLHAAAICAVGSMFLYLPVFVVLPGSAFAAAPWVTWLCKLWCRAC